MSGIFGIINTKGAPIERPWLDSMRENLAHRGPDGWGIYHRESVGLGHLLLQVTPESKYEQSPCQVEGLVVAADARLDAREELMDKLRIPNERRLTITDPEMIGLGYRKWGESCVEHFLGDFAFAVWDDREQQLFCARDHHGVRQFLYYFREDYFIFSSETRALVRHPLVSTEPDQNQLIEHLFGLYTQPTKITWTNIFRLLPAHSLMLNRGKITIQQFWNPQPFRKRRHKKDEEYFEELRFLLNLAVADRIRTDYPIGITVSGGLDSSTVAKIAYDQLTIQGKTLYAASTVDMRYPDKPKNIDAVYLKPLLEALPNMKIAFTNNDEFDYLAHIIPDFERTYDIASGFSYVQSALNELLTKQWEVRRVLTGYFGDITVTNRTIRPPIPILQRGDFTGLLKYLKSRNQFSGDSYWKMIKSELIAPLIGHKLLALRNKWKGRKPFDEHFYLVQSILNSGIDAYPFQKHLTRNHQVVSQQTNYIQRLWNPHNDLFSEIGESRDAHFGLDQVYPLMDKRILEFLFELPTDLFFAEGKPRGLFRASMCKLLPPEIIARYNKGLFAPNYQQVFAKSIVSYQDIMEHCSKNSTFIETISIAPLTEVLTEFKNQLSVGAFDYYRYTLLEAVLKMALFIDWQKQRQNECENGIMV